MSTIKSKYVSAPINGATVEPLVLQTNNVDRVTVSPTGAVTVGGSLTASSLAGPLTGAASDSIGQNQTWQSVIGSRAKRTTYQNTTGRPIVVAVSFVAPFSSTLQLWTHSASANILTSGVMILQADGGDYYTASAQINHPANVSAIIPPNYYYQLFDPNNDATIQYWTELR